MSIMYNIIYSVQGSGYVMYMCSVESVGVRYYNVQCKVQEYNSIYSASDRSVIMYNIANTVNTT